MSFQYIHLKLEFSFQNGLAAKYRDQYIGFLLFNSKYFLISI